MSVRKSEVIRTDTTLVAALGQSQSGWLDIGKRAPELEVVRTNTGGTYVLELDWSRDGGSSVFGGIDTIVATAGVRTPIPAKARWVRVRVKNTHATNPFTAHSTQIFRDMGVGR